MSVVSFNSVLSAWSHCGVYYPDAPQKAEELLKLQLDLLESGSLGKSATPDTQAFSVVISTYARSNLPDKVQQAYRLLQQMLAGVSEGKVLPGKNNVIPFTGVLNAAAHPSSKSNKGGSDTNNKQSTSTSSAIETPGEDFNTIQSDDDYSIALQTYREMKEDVYNIGCKPDHMTFSTMLYVVDAHTQKGSIERRQMVQTLFEDACAAGEVSRLVLKALRSVCPDSTLYASLLGSSELAASIKTVDELPRTWTRNVSQNYRILKRDHTQ